LTCWPAATLAGSPRQPRTLPGRRDHALALEITTAGLARRPGREQLRQLCLEALRRLMERHQLQDPFKFLIYAEMAGAEIGRPHETRTP
jgi:hypothetical protein